jgi:hypothetical protein
VLRKATLGPMGALYVSTPCHLCGAVPSSEEAAQLVFRNPGCAHAACQDCWVKQAEGQLLACREQKRVQPLCMVQDCACAIDHALWQHVCKQSEECEAFRAHARAEVFRLGKVDAVKQISEPEQAGPMCPCCDTHKFALFQHPECGQSACEDCWGAAVERQLSWCKEGMRLRGQCLDPSCSLALPVGLWRHACTRTAAASSFLRDLDEEVARLTLTAQGTLQWPAQACEAGPVCSICSEQHLALLTNGECGHAMCEDCWGGWAAANLDECRGRKRAALQCFAVGCQELAAPEVWQHACTRSEAVHALEKEFVFRRRLQNNELFPASVQVECPRPGCIGLGYLGSESGSVMCFICEHQWSPLDTLTPVGDGATGSSTDSVEDLIARGEIKACPGCNEHILKNGGCDHMTCRCRYEFYWSTLLPYRR